MSDVAFASHKNLMPAGPFTFVAQYGDDKGLIVEFYDEAILQTFESEKQGKPVYKSVPHIHIFAPGNKTDIRRPVKLEDDERSPGDPNRFPRQWVAFQNQQSQVQDGMPLEQWAYLNKAQVLELKSKGLHTVEQLATVPDSAFHNFGLGIREYRDKALSFLNAAEGSAENRRLQAENEAMKTDLEMMKIQIAELSAAHSKGKGKQ